MFEEFNVNGRLCIKGNYVGGKRDGVWKDYYKYGKDHQLQNIGNYVAENVMVWEFYEIDGQLKEG